MGGFPEKYSELRLCSHGTGRIFDRLNKLTGHFVHTGPFATRRLNFRTIKLVPCERNT